MKAGTGLRYYEVCLLAGFMSKVRAIFSRFSKLIPYFIKRIVLVAARDEYESEDEFRIYIYIYIYI